MIKDRDKTKPYGEIYVGLDGLAHFDCHTPGECSFIDSLITFHGFLELLQRQVDNHKVCPIYKKSTDE